MTVRLDFGEPVEKCFWFINIRTADSLYNVSAFGREPNALRY
jgi:hypothetical protein